MAAQQTRDDQRPRSRQRKPLEGVARVLGAGGMEAAARTTERAPSDAEQVEQFEQQETERFRHSAFLKTPARWQRFKNDPSASPRPFHRQPGRGYATRSYPADMRCLFSRKASRRSRFTRALRTALPTLRLTDNPRRGPGAAGSDSSRLRTQSSRSAPATRRPFVKTSSKVVRPLRRESRPNPWLIGNELPAALLAPPGESPATARGAHAGPKSDVLRPLSAVRPVGR